MAYTTNPHLPRVRRDAIYMAQRRGVRMTARYYGVSPGTVSKWKKKAKIYGYGIIPTESSRPKTQPHALSRKTVEAIVRQRLARGRCAEVVRHELAAQGVAVSLSSVKRTLKRAGLLRKRSPWKRPHDYTERPEAAHSGALLQADTVHIIAPDGSRIYIYTLIDLYSRWAYAEVVERIGADASARFVRRARKVAPFHFAMVQTDHGPEFSAWFTHALKRNGIAHRHSRVRQSNDNAHVERFNRTMQEECLDRTAHTIAHFKKALASYMLYYNNERLHLGINLQTPLQKLNKCFQAVG